MHLLNIYVNASYGNEIITIQKYSTISTSLAHKQIWEKTIHIIYNAGIQQCL